MSDRLAEICDAKRAHVANRKRALPMSALEATIESTPAPRPAFSRSCSPDPSRILMPQRK